jgi:hypothetical protein
MGSWHNCQYNPFIIMMGAPDCYLPMEAVAMTTTVEVVAKKEGRTKAPVKFNMINMRKQPDQSLTQIRHTVPY